MTCLITTQISVNGRWFAAVFPENSDTSIFETQWCSSENAALEIAKDWCRTNNHAWRVMD